MIHRRALMPGSWGWSETVPYRFVRKTLCWAPVPSWAREHDRARWMVHGPAPRVGGTEHQSQRIRQNSGLVTTGKQSQQRTTQSKVHTGCAGWSDRVSVKLCGVYMLVKTATCVLGRGSFLLTNVGTTGWVLKWFCRREEGGSVERSLHYKRTKCYVSLTLEH